MTGASSRKRIGRWSNVATRQVVYQTGDALEIEELDLFELTRKRVYFDDILLVTMYSRVGIAFIVTMAVFFLLFILAAAAFQSEHMPNAALTFALGSVPFLLALFARALLKQEVITVFGRRSKASLRFTFRKTFAHEKYNEICELARTSQEAVAASLPPPEVQSIPLEAYPVPPAFVEEEAGAPAAAPEAPPEAEVGVAAPVSEEPSE